MLIRLTVRKFRNLTDLDWNLEGGSQLLLGGNGTGKTSLLEAVYVVATTRSFRTSQIGDCLALDSESDDGAFFIGAEVEGIERRRLELGWSSGSGWRAVNGAKTTLSEHLACLPVIPWTSHHTDVLIGPPEIRRRFLDRGLIGKRPGVLAVLGRYRRALRQKRELLARRQGGLESWNEIVAAAAAELMKLRAGYVAELEEMLRRAVEESGLPFPRLGLRYRPSPSVSEYTAEAIGQELGRIRGRERELGRPLRGPHRDRLDVVWGRHELRRVASAGERKAVGLLLAAAQGAVLARHRRGGSGPVFLLDDADSELDRTTLEAVWRVVASGGQILASSNRPGVWEGLETGARWRVEGGQLSPLGGSSRAP